MAKRLRNKFTNVGLSKKEGQLKLRFSNDIETRINRLQQVGHAQVEMYELPKVMTKLEAAKWLAGQVKTGPKLKVVQETIERLEKKPVQSAGAEAVTVTRRRKA